MLRPQKTYSFKKLHQAAIASVLVMAIVLIGLIWINNEYRHHEEEIKKLRQDYIELRKHKSKALVNNVVNGVEFQQNEVEKRLKESLSDYSKQAWNISKAIYDQNKSKMEENDLKKLIIEALMSMRFFEGRGYFWIHDTNHHLVAHPFRTKSIGQNDRELTDTKGQKITRSFVRAAIDKKSDGFVTYYWNKPDVNELFHKEQGVKKIAYLTLFEPFDWVIGIGEYVEDVEKKNQKEIIRRLASIHSGDKSYLFTHTRKGVCLTHIDNKNIGKNRWELTDANGMKIVQELDRAGRQPGGGFLKYVGTINPDTGQPAHKISFVRSVNNWGWVIGSGVYMADIEQNFVEYRKKILNELKSKIATTIIILLVILVITFFIGNQFFTGLIRELNLFVLKSSDINTTSIDLKQFRITELRAIAERANRLLAEKNRIQNDLIRAKRMESIGILAGGVAHDLNNILSAIVGYPELLLYKLPADSELRKPIMAIQDSGKRAATVVADLLTLARSKARIREVHNLNLLVDEYFQSPEFGELQSEYPEIRYKKDFTTDQPLILCSSVHIKKCIMNLIVNATEAIEGSGEIVVTISLKLRKEADNLCSDIENGEYISLTICDEGPGIHDDDLEHIFEPFYTRKTMGRSGTGLGLTVVWNTVEDHGGKIKVESSKKGTCFCLMFPLCKTAGASILEADEKYPKPGNNEHVLVVDDEPSLREIACQMLETLGYRADSVSSGELAIEYVKSNPVDLLVIDMLMEPGINGRITFERITKLYPDIKAVIASGFSENYDISKALELGVKGFIQKPYSMNQLAGVVKNALQ